MSLKTVRNFMRKKTMGVNTTISNQVLVIDGRFFKGAYKKSGCEYIFGAECDRYANYLINMLSKFLDSNITCFVIFNGAMNSDIEHRKVIHQKVIDRSEGVIPGEENNEFIEPIFIKDIIKEVLNELKIQHFTCEFNAKEALFSVAKKFQCPILTNNFEYCLYGVSCVTLNSSSFTGKGITCTIYHFDVARRYFFNSYDQLAMLITIMNEEDPFYEKLPEIFNFNQNSYRLLHLVQRFIRSESKNNAIFNLTKKLNDAEKKDFINKFSENRDLFFQSRDTLASQFFTRSSRRTRNFRPFEDLVSKGIIPLPYINLNYSGVLSGTWTITDRNKNDAMLPAVDIIFYALEKLTEVSHSKIKFVGRQNNLCVVWEIEREQTKGHTVRWSKESVFDKFVNQQLTGFDFKQLETLPESIWIIIATLLYYITKTKNDFINEAYSIIMSYVMLGPVSEKVGLMKRSNFSLTQNVFDDKASNNDLKCTDCAVAANNLLNLFYVNENSLKEHFDRDILHHLAEFQHCLQHMNYLNKYCDEKILCTTYHKSLNMTFIYNLIICLKGHESPLSLIEKLLNCPSIFSYYKKIVDVFNECRQAIVQ